MRAKKYRVSTRWAPSLESQQTRSLVTASRSRLRGTRELQLSADIGPHGRLTIFATRRFANHLAFESLEVLWNPPQWQNSWLQRQSSATTMHRNHCCLLNQVCFGRRTYSLASRRGYGDSMRTKAINNQSLKMGTDSSYVPVKRSTLLWLCTDIT